MLIIPDHILGASDKVSTELSHISNYEHACEEKPPISFSSLRVVSSSPKFPFVKSLKNEIGLEGLIALQIFDMWDYCSYSPFHNLVSRKDFRLIHNCRSNVMLTGCPNPLSLLTRDTQLSA